MIGLIVAYSTNRVIGNKGKIPWNIEGEKQRFKELTTNNIVIMGRRTYEEIGRPLPNRTTIVVSSKNDYSKDGAATVDSLEKALEIAKELQGKDVFISGGQRLYEESLEIVDKMYITEIDMEIQGDTFFPEFDETLFTRHVEKEVEGNINYRYVTYSRTK